MTLPLTELPQSPEETDSRRLTVIEHLDELRRRVMMCVAAVAATSLLGFGMAGHLLEWMKRPAGDYLLRLAFFSPTEALLAYVKLALTFGAVLALPVMLYEGWRFVRPGLTWRERSYGLAFVGLGSLLFLLGGAFAYWILLPAFLAFLLNVGSPSLEPVMSVSRYLSFVLGVLLTCGMVFELPLVIVLLTRLGILAPSTLRRQRGTALLVLLVVAAVITPTTDAISLVVMTTPLVVLYELSILVASLSLRKVR